MEDERTRGGTADLIGRDERRHETEPGTLEGEPLEERQLPRDEDDATPLVDEESAEGFRARWQETQASFVDEPREAVQEADALVADVIRQLATQFADARSRLEEQWDRGEDVSTEELRLSLQQYRTFFNRLLRV